MDVTCLIQKLDEMGVPKRFYTINGDLSSDTCVLNQNAYKIFENENDACMYLLGILENEMKFW